MTLKQTKKELLKLFYISVDSDLKLWKPGDNSITLLNHKIILPNIDFYSPLYDKFKFYVNMDEHKIYICDGSGPEEISNYKFNLKVRYYVRKIYKSHIEKIKHNNIIKKVQNFQTAINTMNNHKIFKNADRIKKIEHLNKK